MFHLQPPVANCELYYYVGCVDHFVLNNVPSCFENKNGMAEFAAMPFYFSRRLIVVLRRIVFQIVSVYQVKPVAMLKPTKSTRESPEDAKVAAALAAEATPERAATAPVLLSSQP